jgi:hypothetical protein
MTLGQLIDNGLLNEVGQITLNDEMFGHSHWVDEDLRALKVSVDDGRTFTFPLNQEIEINGLDVVARNIQNTSFVLSFEKTVSVDPSQFINPTN